MNDYSIVEEKLNIYSHLLGLLLSFVGFILLVFKALEDYDVSISASFIIFGMSLILLYLSSVLYHATDDVERRFRHKVYDHCAIYILIAGTYTPFTIGAIGGQLGWVIFSVTWVFAIIGIILKVFFTGRFKVISTLMYVFMGWMIVFFIKPLTLTLLDEGFNLLLAGGISYTVGALIYTIKKLKLNHAIFHLFVLAGSICHYLSVYLYI